MGFLARLKAERGTSWPAVLIGVGAAAVAGAAAILLVAQPAGIGTVNGTYVLYYTGGFPAVGIDVSINDFQPADANPLGPFQASTAVDDQGSFVFEDVPAGDLRLGGFYSCPDGSFRTGGSLDILLSPGETLNVEMIWPPATPCPGGNDPSVPSGAAQPTPTTAGLPPVGQAQATTTSTSAPGGTLPGGQAQATTTSASSGPLTLGDGYYLVPSEILVGTWTMAGTGCGWVKIDGGGTEVNKGESNITVNSGDHTVRLLGGCIWTFSG